MPAEQTARSAASTSAVSTSSFSPRSSVSSASSTSNPAFSVCRSVARHAGAVVKNIVKVPTRSSSRTKHPKPDMAKMRTVTPVYDHDLKRWVWPHPVVLHKDEPAGLPCKQLPTSAKQARRVSR